MARHHELSGSLAAEEARGSPAYSRMQALLSQQAVAPPPAATAANSSLDNVTPTPTSAPTSPAAP